MKIKKFLAADMQQALQQVRLELGEDAVIINTTKEPRRLKHLFVRRNIIVTAAADEDVGPRRLAPRKELQQLRQELGDDAVIINTIKEPIRSVKQIFENNDIEVKIADSMTENTAKLLSEPVWQTSSNEDKNWFKYILERELDKRDTGTTVTNQATKSDKESRSGKDFEIEAAINSENGLKNGLEDALVAKWKKVFWYMEINDDITEELFKDYAPVVKYSNVAVEDMLQMHVKAKIIDLLQPAYSKQNGARIHTFIGPTGVGKTLTLAKLATKSIVETKKRIAIIAISNQMFGTTMEKLNFYGSIIGVPIQVVMTPGELTCALESQQDKELIFIDTEGRPSRNRSQVMELQLFINAVQGPQNIHLVLSTPTKNRDLIKIANDFKTVGFNKIIMTKMDETDTYGSMLNLVCNTGVPVSHITNGRNVPDDIEKISPRRFAEIIIGGAVLDEDYQTQLCK